MNLISILLLNGGLTKTLGLGAFGAAILAIPQLLANRFKSKVRKQRKKVNMLSMRSLVYLIIAIGLLILAPILIFLFDSISTYTYIFALLWAIVLGVVHCGLFYTYVDWAQKDIDILPDLFYTLAILIFSIAVFNAICLFTDDNENKAYFAYVMIPFIYTMLALKSYLAYKSIPDSLYEGCKIRDFDFELSDKQKKDFSKDKYKIYVNLEFPDYNVVIPKKPLYTTLSLGANIFIRVDKYNESKDHPPIDMDAQYIFYFKSHIMESKKVIDPYLLVENIGIEEGDTIICKKITEIK